MGRRPKLKFVSKGDVLVHYHDYRVRGGDVRLPPDRRKGPRPTPMCRVDGWQDNKWVWDDGVGADICGRCILREASRQKERAAKHAKLQRKYRKLYPDRYKEAHRKYTEENRRAINLKRKKRKIRAARGS